MNEGASFKVAHFLFILYIPVSTSVCYDHYARTWTTTITTIIMTMMMIIIIRAPESTAMYFWVCNVQKREKGYEVAILFAAGILAPKKEGSSWKLREHRKDGRIISTMEEDSENEH